MLSLSNGNILHGLYCCKGFVNRNCWVVQFNCRL
jgi:hypothetical protein